MRKTIAFAALGFVAIVGVLILLWAVQEEQMHQFDGKCTLCHVGLKDPTILVKEVDHLCLSCHPGNNKRSHPSNIQPRQTLPEQYPLVKGKMVCTTCHFPHRHYSRTGNTGEADLQTPQPPANTDNFATPGPHLLRARRAGKVFCFSCHQNGFTDETTDSHAIAFSRAHTDTTNLDYEQKKLIDDKSRECLSCHDGTISSSTHNRLNRLDWRHSQKIGMSHPISVDYEDVYLRNPREYHPPERLDSRIVLIDGKIGCETCHNHYSKYKKHLVMDNMGSRLCLSCHNL